MTGHRAINNFVEIPEKLYPGVYIEDSLISKRFQVKESETYVRHDLRVWESEFDRKARIRDDDGNLMLGDAIMNDWQKRSEKGVTQLRAYYDVIPAKESSLTLSSTSKNPWGDPLPRIEFKDSHWTQELLGHTKAKVQNTFAEITRASDGKLLKVLEFNDHDHPCGGCRMGEDPNESVVAPYGRTHDHENLWVVGTPTMVSSGCNNGALTFSTLALRSAAAVEPSLK